MHTKIGGCNNGSKGALITVPGEQVPEGHKVMVYISKEFEVPVDAPTTRIAKDKKQEGRFLYVPSPKLINNRQNRAIGLPEDYSYFVHFTGDHLHLQAEIMVSDTNESYYEFEKISPEPKSNRHPVMTLQ